MPYALRLVLSSVTGLDRSAESAAISLCASNWVTLRRVTLPMIILGVACGWVLSFITSFDEVTMTVFVASPSTTTLSVRMYEHITETIDPLIASLSATLIFITMIIMFILDRFYGLDKISARACHLFPFLKDARIVRAWGALRVLSLDGLPLYDRSHDCPGVFGASAYSGVLFAIVYGWLFWGEVPDGWAVAGGAMIIGAGGYILLTRRGVITPPAA